MSYVSEMIDWYIRRIVIWALVIAVPVLMLWMLSCGSTVQAIDAKSSCENFLIDNDMGFVLKAPATAMWPNLDQITVTKFAQPSFGGTHTKFNWRVDGHVDAQNGMGVYLRTKYRCEITYDNGAAVLKSIGRRE